MKIVNLIENNIGNPACVAQHGLSFYFETKKHKVLVDSGADASFLENAKVLGVDLERGRISLSPAQELKSAS